MLFILRNLIYMFIPWHGRQKHLIKRQIKYSNSLFKLEMFGSYCLCVLFSGNVCIHHSSDAALMSPWKHYGYSLTEGRPSGCYVGRHSQASLQKVSDSYTQQALSLLIVHRCLILCARLKEHIFIFTFLGKTTILSELVISYCYEIYRVILLTNNLPKQVIEPTNQLLVCSKIF